MVKIPPDAQGRAAPVSLTPETPKQEIGDGSEGQLLVRFEVTESALPKGLELNQDTGGITGVPARAKPSRFTVTAYNASGLPEARADYEITVRPKPPQSVHLTLDSADRSTLPGVQIELRTALTNGGKTPVRDVELTLATPAGWQVEATSATAFDAVPAGGSASTTWLVTLAAYAAPGDYVLTSAASFHGVGGPGAAEATDQVTVSKVHPTLESAFNNVGITADDNPRDGDFDGSGNSFSEQALADVGLAPGAAIAHEGVRYEWPDVPRGSADVAGGGATIRLDGQAERVGILGSGIGQAVGTFTVHYADGTTADAELAFLNWCCTGDTISGGASLVATARYRNTPSGPANHGAGYRVFAQTIQLDPTKRTVALTLPGAGSVHVFSVGLAG